MRPPTQARSQASLERLLDAAEELLGDGGFEGLTLRTVCDRAGLTSGAFYARFARKQDLALPLVQRLVEETSEVLAEWERSLSRKQLRAAVRDLLKRVAGFYERRTPLLRALIGAARSNAQVREALQEANAQQFGRLVSVFSRLLERDGVRVSETSIFVGLLCVLNTLREVVLERALFKGPYAVTQTAVITELTDFFTCRLGSSGAT